ncbi:hypothetical protein [Blautia sp. TF12-12AT]|uniref:hypothetical protein n=1 Tax=Blautia sp. TF12-12AT TaxID=2292988 RepID=UPI0013144359|nr:hypothetical protein [Blautia sp. TF12-12AT]
MKRRMIAVLLSGILLCSAAGCGKEAVTDKSTAASSSQEVTETPAAEESRRPHRPAQILQQSQPVHPHLLKALEMKEKKQTKNE